MKIIVKKILSWLEWQCVARGVDKLFSKAKVCFSLFNYLLYHQKSRLADKLVFYTKVKFAVFS